MAKKNIIDIGLDTETLSCKPNAAIIAIAAKTFSIGNPGGYYKINEEFNVTIDATSCAMYGMDFDNKTIQWWSQQKSNQQFKCNINIKDALLELSKYLNSVKNDHNADEIRIWTQGTEFDIAILKSAFMNILPDVELPWNYKYIRDSRTFIFEVARLINPEIDDPYSLIPKIEWEQHNCMSDVKNMIHNINSITDLFNNYGKR
jgi:hypothetical protein